MNVQDRFLKYVGFDTQSDESATASPSTSKQLVFAKELVRELKELGIENAYLDPFGIVYAKVEANQDGLARIGFIAHMDTSPDMCGNHVSPRVIEAYDGGDIILNEALGIQMGPKEFENLKDKKGKSLIVTDGTTLLGADDKAGIAEIMTMLEHLQQGNPPHGDICIAFTPDEEIGRGADHFDVERFGADFAYTVDGSQVGGIDYECFNAANATITIHGLSIHPGDAKGKMRNASLLAMEFHSLLPVALNPAYTEGHEGFNHLIYIAGTCEHATLTYIIRNHDEARFANQKLDFIHAAEFMNKKYPAHTVEIEIKDTYANMRSIIEKDMRIIDLAKDAMRAIGLVPTSQAIRGGTDGARLTFAGLPCPNLGTGGYNYHGKFEYACIQEMQASVDLLLQMISNSTKMNQNR